MTKIFIKKGLIIIEASNQLDSLIIKGQLEDISEQVKEDFLKEQKEKYMNLIDDAAGTDTINDTLFMWLHSYLEIHIFIYKNLSQYNKTLIVCTKNKNNDEVILHDLTNETNVRFRSEHNVEKLLSMMFTDLIDIDMPFEQEDIQYYSPSVISNPSRLYESLFKNEFKNINSHFLKSPIELIDFNILRLHADKYQMNYMLDELDNKQFSSELGECLFAYEHEKFYICATGIGGLIEHLLHLSIEKHGDLKGLGNNPTASNYIGALKKEPFNIDKRAQTYIKNIMGFRNSVSHYNAGITSKEICDYLFNGLRDVFINYYHFESLEKP